MLERLQWKWGCHFAFGSQLDRFFKCFPWTCASAPHGTRKTDASMDASSIITQVSRDEEQLNTFPPPDRGEAQVQGPLFCGWRGRIWFSNDGKATFEEGGAPLGNLALCTLIVVEVNDVACRARCGGRAFSGSCGLGSYSFNTQSINYLLPG